MAILVAGRTGYEATRLRQGNQMGFGAWAPGLATVLGALIISWLSLLSRYRGKGRPFGSWRATRWSLSIIGVTAAPAAVALVLPRMPPAYFGAAIPAALTARPGRTLKRNQPTEHAVLWQFASLGVLPMLDRLTTQLEADRDKWAWEQVRPLETPDQLEDLAAHVLATLSGRESMKKDQLTRVKSDCAAVRAAVTAAKVAEAQGRDREMQKQCHIAREALVSMLRRAYEGGHTDAAVIPRRPSSARK